MESVFCFDFDGVLCDSLDECLITGYNAYFGTRTKNMRDIDPGLRDFFYAHRYLTRPAGEHCVLFHAFENKTATLSKQRFLGLKETMTAEMAGYSDRFYKCRETLMEDSEHWLSLHRMYPQAKGFFKKSVSPIFIVTNKDLNSVLKLSARHGYADRIQAVYSREIALNKSVLLKKLFKDHNVSPETHRVVFVDDHESTLRDLESLDINLFLASWGYTGKIVPGRFRVIDRLDQVL